MWKLISEIKELMIQWTFATLNKRGPLLLPREIASSNSEILEVPQYLAWDLKEAAA